MSQHFAILKRRGAQQANSACFGITCGGINVVEMEVGMPCPLSSMPSTERRGPQSSTFFLAFVTLSALVSCSFYQFTTLRCFGILHHLQNPPTPVQTLGSVVSTNIYRYIYYRPNSNLAAMSSYRLLLFTTQRTLSGIDRAVRVMRLKGCCNMLHTYINHRSTHFIF